jgi:hypothetical protein
MGKIKLTPEQRDLAARAVMRVLEEAGENGIPIGDAKNLVTKTLHLGVFPKPDFGKILFSAGTKRVGDRYYAIGSGPKKDKKKPEGEKVVETQGSAATDYCDVDEVRIKKGKMVVTIKNVSKVSIFSVILILLYVGVHVLGLV